MKGKKWNGKIKKYKYDKLTFEGECINGEKKEPQKNIIIIVY